MNLNPAALLETFRNQLSEAESAAVRDAIAAALEADARLWLVGGPVRDLILGRRVADIDIAVDGDAEEFALRLAARTGHKVVRHGRFGTATLRAEGFSIDFALTRRETYARPGALPDVEPAGIEEDLARRDFTVNAMALSLAPASGDLLDPHGGRPDIEARLIRTLHERAFQDDATRMLRACRYAARLGFEVGPQTAHLIRRDLAYLDAISGPRLRRELALLFREPEAPAGAERAQDLGILGRIHPRLRLGGRAASAWREALAGERYAPVDELGFGLVSDCASQGDVTSLSARLHLTAKVERALTDIVRLQDLFAKLEHPALSAPEAVDMLARFAPAAVWAFGLRAVDPVREVCLNYLAAWRRVKTSLNGRDLQGLGLARGPEIGRALKLLRDARLRDEVGTKGQELDLIRREFGLPGPSQ